MRKLIAGQNAENEFLGSTQPSPGQPEHPLFSRFGESHGELKGWGMWRQAGKGCLQDRVQVGSALTKAQGRQHKACT